MVVRLTRIVVKGKSRGSRCIYKLPDSPRSTSIAVLDDFLRCDGGVLRERLASLFLADLGDGFYPAKSFDPFSGFRSSR